ncbi:MAG TPA: nicotinate-nucleotide--dimethylbenzimidazole phosphoribosyltransferase [Gaiellaceae bacterium]|nr:nicotinate-nucleotide--dimethylbenzimidazole phosphoribosyltransferase [Gaiellaceae bacterium]
MPAIAPADRGCCEEARRRLDRKTKPTGSLGELERLVVRIAGARSTADLEPLRAAIVLAAADHGYAAENVSAYPPEVTTQMLANISAGGAAINVLARQVGAELVVVDAGAKEDATRPGVRALRLGSGTANATGGPAMSAAQAERGIAAGVELADELAVSGYGLIALGELGIGNTTAASALAAALLPADPALVCGRGTGIDDAGLARKVDVVRRALSVNADRTGEPLGALAALGGFEVAVLTGVCLGAAANAQIVLLDGFVTATAALVGARLSPAAVDYMVASHRAPEPGHDLVLADLGLIPLFDLGLRLGEGSGAALAVPIVNSALALMAGMATFEEAGVSDR